MMTKGGNFNIDGSGSGGDSDSHWKNNRHHRYRHRRRSSSSRGINNNNDSDNSNNSSSSSSINSSLDEEAVGGGGTGEQTAILDAAAAYMARMEHIYNNNNNNNNSSSNNEISSSSSNEITTTSTSIGQQQHDDDDDDDVTTAIIDVNNITAKYDYCDTGTDDKIIEDRGDGRSSSSSRMMDSSTGGNTPQNNTPGHRHEIAQDDDNDEDDGDEGFMVNSFYCIGEEDGFLNSSSVHESDISETDSEAYYENQEDGDNDMEVVENEVAGDDSATTTSLSAIDSNDIIMVNNNSPYGEVVVNCGVGDDEITANLVMQDDDHDEPRKNDKLFNTLIAGINSPPEAEATSIKENITTTDAPAPSSPAIKSMTTTMATVSSSNRMQHQVNMMPTNPPSPSVLEAVLADTKTPSSKHTSQQQPPPPPQTPLPPSSTCSLRHHDYVTTSLKRMLYQQESELSHVMRSIDALSSTPGRIARLCHEEIMGEVDCDDDEYDDIMVLGEGENDVKTKLDNEDGRKEDHYELSPVKKRLMIDSINDYSHNGASREEKRRLESMAEEGLSQLQEESDCMHSRRSDSEHHDAETLTTMKDIETSMTTPALPQTPSVVEDVGMRSEIISPAMLFTEAATLTALPPSSVTTPTPSEPSMQMNLQSGATADSSPLASRQSTPTSHQSFAPSMPNEPSLQDQLSTVDVNSVGQRTDAVSECETTVSKSEVALKFKLANNRGSGSRTDNENQDFEVPDSIQTLFRDADTLLQNFVASLNLVGNDDGERACFTPSSSLLMSSSQVEDSRRTAENDDIMVSGKVDEENRLEVRDGRKKEHHELSPVEKRLMIDSNNYNGHNGTSTKEKRRLESMTEERQMNLHDESVCVHSRRSGSDHHYLETSTTMKDVETSMTTSDVPQTPSLVEDVGMRSEIESPTMPSMQMNLQYGETADSSPLASDQSTPPAHQSFELLMLNESSLQDQLSPVEVNSVRQGTESVPECETNASKSEIAHILKVAEVSTDNKNHDFEEPDSIQTLFREADTLLQNFCESSDLVGNDDGEQACLMLRNSLLMSSPQIEEDLMASIVGGEEKALNDSEHNVNKEQSVRESSIVDNNDKLPLSPNGDSQTETNAAPAIPVCNSGDDVDVDFSCNLGSGDHFDANVTFDTAIGSLGRLGRDIDHFFDARETMDEVTLADGSDGGIQSQQNTIDGNVSGVCVLTSVDDVQDDTKPPELVDDICVASFAESNKASCSEQSHDEGSVVQNVVADNLPEISRAENALEMFETGEMNTANQPEGQLDAPTMDNHPENSATGHFSTTSVGRDELTPTSPNEERGVDDLPVESISQAAPNSTEISFAEFEDDLQMIDGETRRGQSTLGVLDESMLNESNFMPNISIEAISNSPESPERLPTSAALLVAMSEDESEEGDDSDDEAFFPNNLDFSSRTKAAPAAENQRTEKDQLPVSKCNHEVPALTVVSSIEKKKPGAKIKSTAAKASSSFPPTNNSAVLSRANQGSVSRAKLDQLPPRKEETRKHPKSSASTKRRNRSSLTVTSRECNRKVPPTWSPPSAMKPAKKRSRSLNAASNVRVEGSGEDNKRLSLSDIPVGATSRHKSNLPPSRQSATPAFGRPPVTRNAGEMTKSKVISGKENNGVNTTGKIKSEIKSSISMKQSLVSITRARRQSNTNSQLTSKHRQQKKAVDMERLNRLAEPRHGRSIAPPLNDSPAKSVKKETISSAAGPPSFLSRTSSSRPRAKSTAELEKEEMERIEPFKAQTIRGSSIAIKSRYKTATKLPLPSTQASTPSPMSESESKLKPPTIAKPPPFHYRRESGLYKPTPVRKQVQTFGESVQHYLNHGLRDSLPSPQIKPNATPKPPSFLRRQSLSNTSTMKSSEDIELEECQKQFRARAISFGSTPIVHNGQGRPLPVPRQNLPAQKQRRETPKRDPPRALTTPSPFRLHTNLRAESTRPPLPNADDVELSKKFRALPLPNSSSRFFKGNGTGDTPFHIRARQQYEIAKQKKKTLIKDVIGGNDGRFKARPVPKTTYEALPLEKTVRVQALTQPKPPRLSLSGRAEARKLFDRQSEEVRNNDNALRQTKEQQQKEMEEEEIRRKRRSYADDGGFCFKAMPIRIEYI